MLRAAWVVLGARDGSCWRSRGGRGTSRSATGLTASEEEEDDDDASSGPETPAVEAELGVVVAIVRAYQAELATPLLEWWSTLTRELGFAGSQPTPALLRTAARRLWPGSLRPRPPSPNARDATGGLGVGRVAAAGKLSWLACLCARLVGERTSSAGLDELDALDGRLAAAVLRAMALSDGTSAAVSRTNTSATLSLAFTLFLQQLCRAYVSDANPRPSEVCMARPRPRHPHPLAERPRGRAGSAVVRRPWPHARCFGRSNRLLASPTPLRCSTSLFSACMTQARRSLWARMWTPR